MYTLPLKINSEIKKNNGRCFIIKRIFCTKIKICIKDVLLFELFFFIMKKRMINMQLYVKFIKKKSVESRIDSKYTCRKHALSQFERFK